MPLLDPRRRAQLAEALWGAFITCAYHGLRLCPAALASALGGRLGSLLGRRRFAAASAAVLANLRCIRPRDLAAERAATLDRMWDCVGRLQAETAIIDRVWDAARITVRGEQSVRHALQARKPIVFVFAHLGNWELLAVAAQRLGARLHVVYEILPNRFERQLALRARRRLGYRLVAPTRSGVRQLLAALGRGEAVALAIDEFKQGNVIAPPLGRAPRPDRNAGFAARLARRFDARVIGAYCLRDAPFAFTLTFLDSLERPTAAQLDTLCESWVRACPEQWYMLHRLRLPES